MRRVKYVNKGKEGFIPEAGTTPYGVWFVTLSLSGALELASFLPSH
jgi:hypothetical protein